MFLLPYKVDVPMARWPIANFAIIALTVAAFFAAEYGVLPSSITDALVLRKGEPLGVIGCVLAHADGWHLFGNMFCLWLFGNAVCAKVGNGKYIVLYVALAAAASLTHLLFDGAPAIGASGAVYGVIGMFLVYYPRNQISCLWGWWFGYGYGHSGRFEVDSRAIILFWCALDLWGAFAGGGAIAYAAHLGGWVFGFVFATALLYTRIVVMDATEQSLYDAIEGWIPASLRRLRKPSKATPTHTSFGPELIARKADARPVRGKRALRLRCKCGHVMRINRRHIGKRARCPECKDEFVIPERERSIDLSASTDGAAMGA